MEGGGSADARTITLMERTTKGEKGE